MHDFFKIKPQLEGGTENERDLRLESKRVESKIISGPKISTTIYNV